MGQGSPFLSSFSVDPQVPYTGFIDYLLQAFLCLHSLGATG